MNGLPERWHMHTPSGYCTRASCTARIVIGYDRAQLIFYAEHGEDRTEWPIRDVMVNGRPHVGRRILDWTRDLHATPVG